MLIIKANWNGPKEKVYNKLSNNKEIENQALIRNGDNVAVCVEGNISQAISLLESVLTKPSGMC